MKFILRDTTWDRETEYFESFRVSVCKKCNRIYFIIDHKNYSWVDGCDCNTWIDSYVLSN